MDSLTPTEVTIGLYEGSNEGRAIYLNDTRIAGPKCWGIIYPVKELKMDIDAVVYLRDECTRIIRKMRAERRKKRWPLMPDLTRKPTCDPGVCLTVMKIAQKRIDLLENALTEVIEAFGNSEKWETFVSQGGVFDEVDGDFVYAWDGDTPLSHLIKAKELLEGIR